MAARKPFDDEGYPDHILRWLDAATRRVADEMERTAARGAAARSPRLPAEPRPAHRRVLSMIGNDGVSMTDLAVRAGMTKQALGELVDKLEQLGLAASGRDPADRRVRLVRRTPLGTKAVRDVVELIAEVEAGLRRQIGARRYDDMVRVLREMSRGPRGDGRALG